MSVWFQLISLMLKRDDGALRPNVMMLAHESLVVCLVDNLMISILSANYVVIGVAMIYFVITLDVSLKLICY